MTEPGTHKNVARDSARIGVQAGVVHGGVSVYVTPPDASPEEKFNTGVRFLDGDMPAKARPLIDEAIGAGYVTGEVCFYWLLALVSGRTWGELSEEEAAMLRNRQAMIRRIGDDAWADGVKTVYRLLDLAQKPEADLRVPLKEFDKLGSIQRDMILKHLEMFLSGPLQDRMWDRTLARARQGQKAGERADRVWKFFQPAPAGARRRSTRPAMIPVGIWAQAATGTCVLVAMTVYIGYLLAQSGRGPALIASVLSIPAGYFGARNGMEWQIRTVRRRVKDEEHGRTSPRRRSRAPSDGFARKVDQRFDHYFAKYLPDGLERQFWLAETEGIRRTIRDEIVETYREHRTGVEQISWLIRHRAAEVRDRWQAGTLRNYRTELATPLRTKVRAVLGLAALAGGGGWAVGEAVLSSPPSAAPTTALMLAAGWIATAAWSNISLERRRAVVDRAESEQAWKGDKAAFDRWREKLANRPEDREMAAWLDCDRKVLLNEALEHYKLTISKVIAYAFIEARAGSAGRARVRRGPWRYRRYRLLVFLLTAAGVRQLAVQLDFERGTFHDRHRANYRYEAVAAVRVRQADDDERTFELALVNGQEIRAQVMGPGMEEPQEGESPEDVSEMTLDASGLHHTLHVLEGIAAEGKEWIAREYLRGEARTGNLTAAMRNPAP